MIECKKSGCEDYMPCDVDKQNVTELMLRLQKLEAENKKLNDLLKQTVEDIRIMQPYYNGCDKCKAYSDWR